MGFRKDFFDVSRFYHYHLMILDVLEYSELAQQENPQSC